MKHSAVEVVDALSALATERIDPAQLCLVIVREPTGSGSEAIAFRHTCASNAEVIQNLRTIADAIESEERARESRRSNRLRRPKRVRVDPRA